MSDPPPGAEFPADMRPQPYTWRKCAAYDKGVAIYEKHKVAINPCCYLCPGEITSWIFGLVKKAYQKALIALTR